MDEYELTYYSSDVLVCATGFDVSTRPHFDVVGRDGYTFTDEWAKSPKGYLTLAMSNMPNYFCASGLSLSPFSAY